MRNNVHASTLGALSLALLLGPGGPEAPVADAAQQRDAETVRELVRKGADVNAAQPDGMTALHWSAVNGDIATMQVLLYAGANREPTTRLGGYTPLHLAAQNGKHDAVQLLIDAGSDVNAYTATGVTPLHFAAENGNPATVRILVERGAEVDAPDQHAGRTPLMFATARENLEAMDALVEAGADVSLTTTVKDYVSIAREDGQERERRTRIQRAAEPPRPRPAPERSSRPAAAATPAPAPAKAAEEKKAAAPDSTARTGRPDPAYPPEPDPSSPPAPPGAGARGTGGPAPRSLSYNDLVGKQGGFSALHYAARDGHIDAAERLLAAGADVNQVTEGDQSSPLLVAVINGNYDLAMKLIEWGADPNLVSDDGAGPLFATINTQWSLRTWYPQPTAYQQQNTTYLELMERLLEAGADPNARLATHLWYAAYNAGRMGVDFAGATPFWRAAYGLDVDAMKLLVAHGADPNIRTIKPAGRSFRRLLPDTTDTRDSTETEADPSGLPPVPVGGPAVHALHAASGVGYGTSRVGQQHRHVPDGWLPAVRYLVEDLGVDVNLRDHEGYSAVHHAAARGDNAVIEFLVSHGADVTFVSRRGQTTVDMANGPQQRVQPFPETIALLERLGAKNNHNCLSCE